MYATCGWKTAYNFWPNFTQYFAKNASSHHCFVCEKALEDSPRWWSGLPHSASTNESDHLALLHLYTLPFIPGDSTMTTIEFDDVREIKRLISAARGCATKSSSWRQFRVRHNILQWLLFLYYPIIRLAASRSRLRKSQRNQINGEILYVLLATNQSDFELSGCTAYLSQSFILFHDVKFIAHNYNGNSRRSLRFMDLITNLACLFERTGIRNIVY